MGWCSATQIMDTAIDAARAGIEAGVFAGADAVWEQEGIPQSAVRAKAVEDARDSADLDAILSPFVDSLATMLRDGDWDCIEESKYFDRFPQEMLGMDDTRYQAWLLDRVRGTDPDESNFADLVGRLAEVTQRMETED